MVRRYVTIAGSITSEKMLVSRRTVSWFRTRDANEDDGCRDKLHVFVLL
jgi:hypothetical protein